MCLLWLNFTPNFFCPPTPRIGGLLYLSLYHKCWGILPFRLYLPCRRFLPSLQLGGIEGGAIEKPMCTMCLLWLIFESSFFCPPTPRIGGLSSVGLYHKCWGILPCWKYLPCRRFLPSPQLGGLRGATYCGLCAYCGFFYPIQISFLP